VFGKELVSGSKDLDHADHIKFVKGRDRQYYNVPVDRM
jgi:hypothetical protein